MLHRFIFSLCLLFAFTQIGLVTHEISHLNANSQHNHHDQHTPSDPCSQCLAYAQSETSHLSQLAGISITAFTFDFGLPNLSQPKLASHYHYSARAPPLCLV